MDLGIGMFAAEVRQSSSACKTAERVPPSANYRIRAAAQGRNEATELAGAGEVRPAQQSSRHQAIHNSGPAARGSDCAGRGPLNSVRGSTIKIARTSRKQF